MRVLLECLDKDGAPVPVGAVGEQALRAPSGLSRRAGWHLGHDPAYRDDDAGQRSSATPQRDQPTHPAYSARRGLAPGADIDSTDVTRAPMPHSATRAGSRPRSMRTEST